MTKSVCIAFVVLFLGLTAMTDGRASASTNGGCPDGFSLHTVHEHDEHHGHQHVGTDTDHNGDGLICAKHVSQGGNIHVHVDNNAAVP